MLMVEKIIQKTIWELGIMEYISEIISFLLGGALGSLLTIHISKKTAQNGSKVIDQSKARAGGDITGGDKTTF